MKKIVILLLTICMAVLFAACGGASGEADDAENSQAQAEQASQAEEQETQMDTKQAKLLYMGHGSIRITTAEDKVIYVDPFGKTYKLRDEKDSFGAEKVEWLLM